MIGHCLAICIGYFFYAVPGVEFLFAYISNGEYLAQQHRADRFHNFTLQAIKKFLATACILLQY
jgi:hypothetical protein